MRHVAFPLGGRWTRSGRMRGSAHGELRNRHLSGDFVPARRGAAHERSRSRRHFPLVPPRQVDAQRTDEGQCSFPSLRAQRRVPSYVVLRARKHDPLPPLILVLRGVSARTGGFTPPKGILRSTAFRSARRRRRHTPDTRKEYLLAEVFRSRGAREPKV